METRLRQGLEILRERGWIKGTLMNPSGVCLVGALYEAWEVENEEELWTLDGFQDLKRVAHVIKEQYPDRCYDYLDIPSFNDHPLTTLLDVERVMEKAIVMADEEI